jgi:hypothetical protein
VRSFADPDRTGSLSRSQFLALFRRCLDGGDRLAPAAHADSTAHADGGADDAPPARLRAARSERIRLAGGAANKHKREHEHEHKHEHKHEPIEQTNKQTSKQTWARTQPH